MWRCRVFHVRQQDDSGRGSSRAKGSARLTATWRVVVGNLALAANVYVNHATHVDEHGTAPAIMASYSGWYLFLGLCTVWDITSVGL